MRPLLVCAQLVALRGPGGSQICSGVKLTYRRDTDINKIIRSAYGGQAEYQDLTQEALSAWNSWNEEIASGKTVPPGMTTADRVFINNGHMVLTDAESQESLPAFELETIAGMEVAGHENTQLVTTDPRHQEIARSNGMEDYMNAFQRKDRNRTKVGVLDSTGGQAVADKACCFALCKARKLGVQFVLDPVAGDLESVCYGTGSGTRRAIGIKTRDGSVHHAAMNILACGGWTPSLIPELDDLCEATAGSVALLKIPRESSWFGRLGPDKLPSWQYKMRDGVEGGLYGFPRDDNGWLKIGYRGTKYTNPMEQGDGKERSTPVTRWSSPDDGNDQRIKAVPKQALKVIQSFLDEFLPELAAEGIEISLTRVCWYTDSFDNHFVTDHVPGVDGLMVATGGSGHAFKYLPNIGNWVVDALEGVGLERPALKAWRWRKFEAGTEPVNVLMEGTQGSRALGNVPLSSNTEWSLGEKAKL